MMVMAWLYFYYLLVYSVKQRSELESTVRALVYLGLIVSIYGLVERLSGHSHILWWQH